eukprot:8831805-Alexandrium_andersonii.AAC.1
MQGLRIAAGLGARPDCRIEDYSSTWEALHQARLQQNGAFFRKRASRRNGTFAERVLAKRPVRNE